MLEQALVTAAEQPRRDAPENLEELAEEVDDLHELGGEALQPPKNARFYHAPERASEGSAATACALRRWKGRETSPGSAPRRGSALRNAGADRSSGQCCP